MGVPISDYFVGRGPDALPEGNGPCLAIKNLVCERDFRELFSSLSYGFEAGCLYQIEGPNGAGKTTLLNILAGLYDNYLGEIFWQGRERQQCWDEFTAASLFIGHLPGIKQKLTALENLRWLTALQGQQLATEALLEALAQVRLKGYEHSLCSQLSAGQKRRVALARLYLPAPPKLWLLDEPLTAIDKPGVVQLEQRFQAHLDGGGLILLTTHQDLSLARVQRLNLLELAHG